MNSKINALLQLGEFLKEYKRDTHHDHEFTKALDKAYQANGWFDTDQLDFALKSWGKPFKNS